MNARPLNNRLNESGFTQVELFVLVEGSAVRHESAHDNPTVNNE